jgi:hypothetical protein
MAPDWLLSPRLHYFRAVVAEALQDVDQMALARFEMSACLDGLLATGNGSAIRPYVVTYLSDVLDLLQLQQKTALRRRVMPERDSLRDVIHCDDGRQRHFLHPPWTGKRCSLRSMNRALAPITA